MDFDKLLEFIEIQHDRLANHLYKESSTKERILSRSVKMTEEVGELSNEVLLYLGEGRPDKIENRDPENLGAEIADVIITTLLLAKSMNVDVKSALEKKIEKIHKRFS